MTRRQALCDALSDGLDLVPDGAAQVTLLLCQLGGLYQLVEGRGKGCVRAAP